MTDTRNQLAEAFRRGLDEIPDDVFWELSPDEAEEQGRRAAGQVVAPVLWARIAGDSLDTATVSRLLGISRQAINKRLASGSLVGLPGRGTTYFPSWQFDLDTGSIRPETRLIVAAFREEMETADPYVIVAWVQTPQEEDLGGLTPLDWIRKGKPPEPLVDAARRAAARLAA